MRVFSKTYKDIKKLTGSKRERADALVSKLGFMDEQAEMLQAELKENGWVEEYSNGGGQYGLKRRPEADIYNTLIRNYNSTMKQLEDMLKGADTQGESVDEKLSRLMDNE